MIHFPVVVCTSLVDVGLPAFGSVDFGVVHLASVAGHRQPWKVQPRVGDGQRARLPAVAKTPPDRQPFLISEFDELTKNT